MKQLKKYSWVIAIFVALLISAIIIRYQLQKKHPNNKFARNIRVYAVTIPEYLNFCGEKIPTDDYEIFERFDKELSLNAFSQPQTILNIKRGSRYFPIIEGILKRNGVPDDFKYVCMIESGLSNVTSYSNAVGFWQFIEETGRKFGLRINDEVDERYDIVKSTEAACAYFKEAYAQFNSWTLAAASYNLGINGIQGALNKQDADSYYDLYLNAETSRYIMRLLAVKEVYEHPKNYGYYIPQFLRYPPVPMYSEQVSGAIPDLQEYAKAHKISYKVFKTLNPWLRKNELKNPDSSTFKIYFPKEGSEHLISDFYGYDEQPDSNNVAPLLIVPVDSLPVVASIPDTLVYVELNHIVEKTEDINAVALRYHCTAANLVLWNNLETAAVKKDQVLRILIRKDLLGSVKLQEEKK